MKDFYSTDETTKILKMSKPTLLKKLKEGLIAYSGKGGRGGFRISRDEIIRYANNYLIAPNWGDEENQEKEFNKKEFLEILKYKNLEKDIYKLDLELLELEPDTKDKKIRVLLIKKKILEIEKLNLAYNIIK